MSLASRARTASRRRSGRSAKDSGCDDGSHCAGVPVTILTAGYLRTSEGQVGAFVVASGDMPGWPGEGLAPLLDGVQLVGTQLLHRQHRAERTHCDRSDPCVGTQVDLSHIDAVGDAQPGEAWLNRSRLTDSPTSDNATSTASMRRSTSSAVDPKKSRVAGTSIDDASHDKCGAASQREPVGLR